MKRLLLGFVLVLVLGALGCAGDTDPATNVTNVSAQLNAHGRSTGEPATWWWEYSTVQANLGTASDTEVCGVGTGPKEPDNRCGPATSPGSNDIPLNFVVSGLTPNTTYYFRACGKDQSWSQGACGSVKSFKTLAGTSYAFDSEWGTPGSGNGQFTNPSGLAVDSVPNVYVSDTFNRRIQKFSSTGTFITKWGGPGTGPGQFSGGPLRLDTNASNNVYVLERGGGFEFIHRFTSAGAFLSKWGGVGSGNGQFDTPVDVETDPAGNVYVAEDGSNDRIQKFSATGGFITKWGTAGTGNGQFDHIRGLAVDGASNAYTTEEPLSTPERVQKFNSTGTYLAQWALPDLFPGPGDITADAAGSLYVVNGGEIYKYSPTGALITQWEVSDASQVGVDRFGYVYVLDDPGTKVHKFKPVQ